MNKKIFILFLFSFVFSLSLFSMVVEDFEHFSISQVKTTGISNVFLSSYYYTTLGYSLSIERNIGVYKECPSASDWSVANEVNILPTQKNWTGHKYFGFWIKDIANLQGTGASSYSISVLDGDEEWMHELGFSDDDWHHIIIYLKDTDLGTKYWDSCSASTQYSSDTKGFSLPKWEISDPYYVGNGQLDLNNIQDIKISFGNAAPIRGECLIDNIRVFNEIKSSIPSFYNEYITYLSKAPDKLKFNFEEDMDANSLFSSFKMYTNNNSFGISVTYDSVLKQAVVIPLSGFKTNVLYKVVMDTNMLFANKLRIIDNVENYFMIKTNIKLGVTPGMINFENGLSMGLQTNSFLQNYHFESYSVVPVNLSTTIRTVLEYKLTPIIKAEKKIYYSIDYSCLTNINLGQLKIYYKEGESYTEVHANIDTDKKNIAFYSYNVGDFVVGSVDSSVKLQNDIVRVTSVENKIFKPDAGELVTVNFSLGGGISKIKGYIVDASGKIVKTYNNLKISDIENGFIWNGATDTEQILPSGIYIVVLTFYAGNDDVEEFYGWSENKGQAQSIKVPVIIYR